ncbi:DNA-3-methyladenine glycosylase family protein [Novosphingobium sediminicola]|uniref:DNA-3-methyladenine glycosylase II n=1 Tax=Novosphingobium sediminicola TaxID=563162 RepID=A0A7W6G8E8_9SPHN|nr:3-methyladenine DNA glycosylase [Novosphingobium sediminicola]MBB3955947.1 DNA-3-methyladenine glycosylase II [Novosphingobium sediminicola]
MSDPTSPLSSRDTRRSAYKHLRKQFPQLNWLFDATGEVALPDPSILPVAGSLVRIVVGQMLSLSAARTIMARLNDKANQRGLSLQDLPLDDLRTAGVSGRKAKTIGIISQMVRDDADCFEKWRRLDYPALQKDVKEVWGLGDWSAAMLGIFEFGHPDLFPLSDGSLIRALELVEARYCGGDPLGHELAAPYRSFLALALWQALDSHILTPANE